MIFPPWVSGSDPETAVPNPQSTIMKILVANLGSTSFKFRLISIDGQEERSVAQGGFERIQDHGEAIDRWRLGEVLQVTAISRYRFQSVIIHQNEHDVGFLCRVRGFLCRVQARGQQASSGDE